MYNLRLDSDYPYRLLTEVQVSDIAGRMYPIGCIVDSGCVNTLLDSHLLRYLKHLDLGFTQHMRIAGSSFESKAVVLHQLGFNGLCVQNAIVFAAPLVGTPVANRMLLGLNILNNWNYTVKRTAHVIEVTESRELLPGLGGKNKYTNYFDRDGKYVLFAANN